MQIYQKGPEFWGIRDVWKKNESNNQYKENWDSKMMDDIDMDQPAE